MHKYTNDLDKKNFLLDIQFYRAADNSSQT